MTKIFPKIDYEFSGTLECNETYNIFLTVPRSREVLGTGCRLPV